MKTAAISVLKAKLSEHIALVKRGEEVIITEHGKPVARLVPMGPPSSDEERVRRLVERGAVRPGRGDWRRHLADLPICQVAEGTVERLMEEEREERF